MANDDPNKITVNTKVSNDLHTMLGETANWITSGSISALLREMIMEWYESRRNNKQLPARIKMKIIKRMRYERQQLEAELYEEYLNELKYPDSEYAASLAETAKENKIDWPPKAVDLSELLPKYRCILDHLRYNNGVSTVRDLTRSLNISKDELVDRLVNLTEAGKIKTDEIVNNKPANVYLIDTNSIDEDVSF